MIPQGGTLTNTVVTSVAPAPGRTYQLDWTRGRVMGKTDGLEAVKQAVLKMLDTDRFEHLIYSGNYGSEWGHLVGKSQAVVMSELNRRIREALVQDDRVEAVEDLAIEFSGDQATARFTVISSYGSFTAEKVV